MRLGNSMKSDRNQAISNRIVIIAVLASAIHACASDPDFPRHTPCPQPDAGRILHFTGFLERSPLSFSTARSLSFYLCSGNCICSSSRQIPQDYRRRIWIIGCIPARYFLYDPSIGRTLNVTAGCSNTSQHDGRRNNWSRPFKGMVAGKRHYRVHWDSRPVDGVMDYHFVDGMVPSSHIRSIFH